MIYEKCREILLRECEVVQEAAVLHEKAREAVFNREWEGFQEHISALNKIENRLESLDNEREKIFTAFEALVKNNAYSDHSEGDENRFYSIVRHLPEEQRSELTAIYNSLKMETLKLRLSNETLTTYLAGIRSTIKEFFELAFPERAGKVYTPQGTHLSHDMRSMVVNRSF